MEKTPHKSSWKTRKRKQEERPLERRKSTSDLERREILNKVKRNAMITAVLVIIPVLSYLGSMVIPYLGLVAFLAPIFELIAVMIIVFWIYYPIKDLLEKPEK